MKKLSSIGEFGWLKRLIPSLYWPASLHPQLCIGPGDDAGALRLSRGRVLVASTDAMVEGIHFEPRWFSWDDLGYKVLAVNLSDLAAMGEVKPLAALVTAAFPGDTPVDHVDKFYKGLESCAQQWKTGLLGGDTVGSKQGWFVSVAVFGEASASRLVQRRHARPGDILVTSGPLGLAAAGLEILMTGASYQPWMNSLLAAFRRPVPRLKESAVLASRRLLTSLMDCSDGLEASARILAEASGVGIEIEGDSILVTPELAAWAKRRGKDPLAYAVSGGEDYELLFTLPESRWSVVHRLLPRASRIGRIVPARQGCTLLRSGRRASLHRYGFSHFAK